MDRNIPAPNSLIQRVERGQVQEPNRFLAAQPAVTGFG
jgi:hypothetical protein